MEVQATRENSKIPYPSTYNLLVPAFAGEAWYNRFVRNKYVLRGYWRFEYLRRLYLEAWPWDLQWRGFVHVKSHLRNLLMKSLSCNLSAELALNILKSLGSNPLVENESNKNPEINDTIMYLSNKMTGWKACGRIFGVNLDIYFACQFVVLEVNIGESLIILSRHLRHSNKYYSWLTRMRSSQRSSSANKESWLRREFGHQVVRWGS